MAAVVRSGGLVCRGEKPGKNGVVVIQLYPGLLSRVFVSQYKETMDDIMGGGVQTPLMAAEARRFFALFPPFKEASAAIEVTAVRTVKSG